MMSKQGLNRVVRHLEHTGYCGWSRWSPTSGHGSFASPQQVLATIRELHAEIEAQWAERIGERKFTALQNAMIDLTTDINNTPKALRRPGPRPLASVRRRSD